MGGMPQVIMFQPRRNSILPRDMDAYSTTWTQSTNLQGGPIDKVHRKTTIFAVIAENGAIGFQLSFTAINNSSIYGHDEQGHDNGISEPKNIEEEKLVKNKKTKFKRHRCMETDKEMPEFAKKYLVFRTPLRESAKDNNFQTMIIIDGKL